MRQQVARLQLQGRQQSPAWPPRALERGVLELAEHFCSFAATWRGLSPSGLGPAGLRELLGLVSKLLQRAGSKLLKVGRLLAGMGSGALGTAPWACRHCGLGTGPQL